MTSEWGCAEMMKILNEHPLRLIMIKGKLKKQIPNALIRKRLFFQFILLTFFCFASTNVYSAQQNLFEDLSKLKSYNFSGPRLLTTYVVTPPSSDVECVTKVENFKCFNIDRFCSDLSNLPNSMKDKYCSKPHQSHYCQIPFEGRKFDGQTVKGNVFLDMITQSTIGTFFTGDHVSAFQNRQFLHWDTIATARKLVSNYRCQDKKIMVGENYFDLGNNDEKKEFLINESSKKECDECLYYMPGEEIDFEDP